MKFCNLLSHIGLLSFFAGFTCRATVLFATINAVCNRRDGLLKLRFEPVCADANINHQGDVQHDRGGHFVLGERLKF